MKHAQLEQILFLDIETVAGFEEYSEMPEALQKHWNRKASFFKEAEQKTPEELYGRAGIYSEFGKIVTIAVGYFHVDGDENIQLRIKAFSSDNEVELLQAFAKLLSDSFPPSVKLCAHNGKEFDFPYIARRMVIQGIELPKPLQMSGKKPWEIPHLDTLELWKFGDYKHFTSLDLLAHILGIPSSKSDIDGSQVNEVYYKEKNLDRITEYCKRDVAVLAQVFLKLQGMPLLNNSAIHML
tara:strand:- start:355 stop:1071 length:717 start_codon:yes stop_codon:yes gene_type:complete